MNTLTSLWVCTEAVGLVRGDHVRAVYAARPETITQPALPEEIRGADVAVCAEVAPGPEGTGARAVILGRCHEGIVVEVLGELTWQLTMAQRTPEEGGPTYLFLNYETDARPEWVVAPQLPRTWPEPPQAEPVPTSGALATDEALQALREKLSAGQ
ncbi:hypothetical protein [Actinomadura roseirufa]|uniref:hypothetical protein n=1 Tax=Actinomadura roseirufa TaxID=2094049 RepID=UPI001040E39C|nr:hypothetical protein [Actinomadura roseirufa]